MGLSPSLLVIRKALHLLWFKVKTRRKGPLIAISVTQLSIPTLPYVSRTFLFFPKPVSQITVQLSTSAEKRNIWSHKFLSYCKLKKRGGKSDTVSNISLTVSSAGKTWNKQGGEKEGNWVCKSEQKDWTSTPANVARGLWEVHKRSDKNKTNMCLGAWRDRLISS